MAVNVNIVQNVNIVIIISFYNNSSQRPSIPAISSLPILSIPLLPTSLLSPSLLHPYLFIAFPLHCVQYHTLHRGDYLPKKLVPLQNLSSQSTPEQPMPPLISIATQNVGGMRGEFQKKLGPKFDILKRLATRSLCFWVLTEVRCDPGNIRKSKITNSVSPQAQGGVKVYSQPDYELINHSVRRSSTPGHYAIGVYITPTNLKLIIAGIYGPSANDDRESHAFY